MIERALRFGAEQHLIGVLSEPDGGTRPGSQAVIFSNVGLGHRMGPNRFFVDLARRLASEGVTSLRFSLSGLGDSAVRSEAASTVERGRLDLLDAMEHLRARRGLERFALVSMCSGVDSAYKVALADPRIAAAVFLDGYAYETPSYQLHRLVHAAWRPGRWVRWAKRNLQGPEPGGADIPEGGEAVGFFERTYPKREQFREDVLAMARRGVRLYFHFSFESYHINHLSQFAEILGVRTLPPGVAAEYGLTDHMLTSVAAREGLTNRLLRWLTAPAPTRREEPILVPIRPAIAQGAAL